MDSQAALLAFLKRRHYTGEFQDQPTASQPLLFSEQIVVKDPHQQVTAYVSLFQKNQILLLQAMPNAVVKELCRFSQQVPDRDLSTYDVAVQLPRHDFTVLKQLFEKGLTQPKLQLSTEEKHCLHHLRRQFNHQGDGQ